jgi:hypothetical protein
MHSDEIRTAAAVRRAKRTRRDSRKDIPSIASNVYMEKRGFSCRPVHAPRYSVHDSAAALAVVCTTDVRRCDRGPLKGRASNENHVKDDEVRCDSRRRRDEPAFQQQQQQQLGAAVESNARIPTGRRRLAGNSSKLFNAAR